ncbi:hypothetical protein [Absidia glauca]|uniref:Uncharacterized protein n=1 Tax=Absidia glauca TaxID=4829 RepID=A0A163K7T5_ABSGL|nr:hypothetical protein [Absidia glauca]
MENIYLADPSLSSSSIFFFRLFSHCHESVRHLSTLHFFTEIYPNKTIQSFFGHQALNSTQSQYERKQQRRRSAPAPSPIDNSTVPQQRYQRWS